MKIGQIVTLEDNEQYLLMIDMFYNDHHYFYANLLTSEEKLTATYEVFEEIVEGEDIYLEVVDDESARRFLLKEFSAKINDIVYNN